MLPRDPFEDGVRADALTQEQKRSVWSHIRQHEPELAAFLTCPDMTAVRDRINALFPNACSPIIPWRTLRAALSEHDVWDLGGR